MRLVKISLWLLCSSLFVFSCENSKIIESQTIDEVSKKNLRIFANTDAKMMNDNLENKEQKEKIENKNGIFHFKNVDGFIDFLKNYNLEKKDFDFKFKETFIDKNNKLDQIGKKIAAAKDDDDLLNIVKQHSDYLYIADSTVKYKNRNSYDFLFSAPAKNYIYIGKMIYLFENDATYIITDGDIGKITKCKQKLQDIENVLVDKKTNNITKNGRPNHLVDYSDFDIKGRVYNGDRRRGIAGVKQFPGAFLVSTNTGQPLYGLVTELYTEGYQERRFLLLWSEVESYSSLSVNYIAKATLNGVIVNSNATMPKPKPLIGPAFRNYTNDREFIYGSNPLSGGSNIFTLTQKNQLVHTVTSSGGYYTTEQVPGTNITY
jgi:hypothetical protein